LSANVPGGALRRNWEKEIRTAPVRNCSNATLAEKENVPPGRVKTSAERGLGSRKRTSFNGNIIISPAFFGITPGAAVMGFAPGEDDRGGGAGAAARPSVTGATAGGELARFENSFLKASNMDRAAGHTGNYLSARR
jgi:hypothetical protein